MYARQITSEETYTLAEAKRIIKAETKAKRELFISKAKQKLLALVSLAVCALIPVACDGDCTAWIIMIPVTVLLWKGECE